MNIIIACEESQAICIEFRKRGHNAFSCDLQECSGGYPEWHFNGSIWDYIDGGMLVTQSGELVNISHWDILIGHPPCTFLSGAGNDWFNREKYPDAILRWLKRYEAVEFFCKMMYDKIPKICLENPVGYMNSIYPPSQTIEPFYFGDADRKKTCLWLKNLPRLIHVKQGDMFDAQTHVEVKPIYIDESGKKRYFTDSISGKSKDAQKLRSKTFGGIAKSMADQWG